MSIFKEIDDYDEEDVLNWRNYKIVNPFITHRDFLLQSCDNSAYVIRRYVISMWDDNFQTNLSGLKNLQLQHFEIAVDLMNYYWMYGRNAKTFRALVAEIRKKWPWELA